MPKIKDIPVSERPREKAWRYGINTLSNVELLAILIGSGTRNQSAVDIATLVSQTHPSLLGIFDSDPILFKSIKGLSRAKSIKLAAAFELGKRYKLASIVNSNAVIDSEYIYQLVGPRFTGLDKEKYGVVVLNIKRQIVKEEFSDVCAEDFIKIGLKDVLSTCLKNNGKYFYLVHNHPGNTMEASIEDIRITYLLRTECPKFGVHMLDHLIITSKGYVSVTYNRKNLVGK